jgi:hypothetical protein
MVACDQDAIPLALNKRPKVLYSAVRCIAPRYLRRSALFKPAIVSETWYV